MESENQKSAIVIDDQQLAEVFWFKYLGTRVNKVGTMEDEVKARLHVASNSLRRLKKIFRHRRLFKATKLRLYKTVVVSSLLWDCNNWKLSKRELERFESFNHQALLRIMGHTMWDQLTR